MLILSPCFSLREATPYNRRKTDLESWMLARYFRLLTPLCTFLLSLWPHGMFFHSSIHTWFFQIARALCYSELPSDHPAVWRYSHPLPVRNSSLCSDHIGCGSYFKSIQTAGLTALNFQIKVFLRQILPCADKITLFSSISPLRQLHFNVQYAIIRKKK